MPELTDRMIFRLSKKITSPFQLHILAIDGLSIKKFVIDRHVKDEKDNIPMATLALLNEWKLQYEDQKRAFLDLCYALDKSNMASYKDTMLTDSSDMKN